MKDRLSGKEWKAPVTPTVPCSCGHRHSRHAVPETDTRAERKGARGWRFVKMCAGCTCDAYRP